MPERVGKFTFLPASSPMRPGLAAVARAFVAAPKAAINVPRYLNEWKRTSKIGKPFSSPRPHRFETSWIIRKSLMHKDLTFYRGAGVGTQIAPVISSLRVSFRATNFSMIHATPSAPEADSG